MNYGTIEARLREGLYSGGGYDLRADAAAATRLDKYPPAVQQFVWGEAYERGHASGYHEVWSIYQDLADGVIEMLGAVGVKPAGP